MAPGLDEQKQRRRTEKRDEILAAAAEIFLSEGYGRASMDQVHAKIGGSKRTLYNYFRNKEALFEAIINEVSDRALAALKPPLQEDDLSSALLKMGTGYLTVLLSPEGLALYRAMISEAPHFPDLARAFFDNGPGRGSRHLANFIREQKARGVVDVNDPQIAAEQFLGAVRGDIHLAAALGIRQPSKQLVTATVTQAVETFVRGTELKCDNR
ncbi:TetR/AcrR family transcriptional regulator [Leisingera aquaemixtae]|uniref:TetR/AcrR family transcriptional regulator n=1 Tax=Leisingera aquaemixtae TaxID=1396826 RepID=UPI0021A8C5DE|nr:TetR/AcrR family transcriptional regulator [Leisingera aquaemixtae]UWQ36899.1 TetR/AcrR family transcriptional regulator [Leisingera aquaemixtae]